MKNKYRQGELLIVPVDNVSGDKQANLVIANWEGQNSKHEFKSGDAELYFVDEVTLNALIKSEVGVITHPEHGDLEIPKGAYKIIIQREYLPDISEYERCRKNASDAINRLVEAVFNTDPDKINTNAYISGGIIGHSGVYIANLVNVSIIFSDFSNVIGYNQGGF